MPQPLLFEIAPKDVKAKLDARANIKLIDVRQPEEYLLARIEGSELIPMGTVAARLQSIEGDAESATVVVVCHHGVRSLQVVSWLRGQGVEACQSMSGGIDRWSVEVDPAVPRY